MNFESISASSGDENNRLNRPFEKEVRTSIDTKDEEKFLSKDSVEPTPELLRDLKEISERKRSITDRSNFSVVENLDAGESTTNITINGSEEVGKDGASGPRVSLSGFDSEVLRVSGEEKEDEIENEKLSEGGNFDKGPQKYAEKGVVKKYILEGEKNESDTYTENLRSKNNLELESEDEKKIEAKTTKDDSLKRENPVSYTKETLSTSGWEEFDKKHEKLNVLNVLGGNLDKEQDESKWSRWEAFVRAMNSMTFKSKVMKGIAENLKVNRKKAAIIASLLLTSVALYSKGSFADTNTSHVPPPTNKLENVVRVSPDFDNKASVAIGSIALEDVDLPSFQSVLDEGGKKVEVDEEKNSPEVSETKTEKIPEVKTEAIINGVNGHIESTPVPPLVPPPPPERNTLKNSSYERGGTVSAVVEATFSKKVKSPPRFEAPVQKPVKKVGKFGGFMKKLLGFNGNGGGVEIIYQKNVRPVNEFENRRTEGNIDISVRH